jgi:uncharacterized protein
MLAPITIRYPITPTRRSLAASQVADLFGIVDDCSPHIVAENLQLEISPQELVLFTGPSGSGKSSLLREVGHQLQAIDANALALPEVPLVEALLGWVDERISILTGCGLGEARLMLRTPSELSEGQRYRFRIAYAVSQPGDLPIMLDEFAAVLDRTLAKVVAFNLRKLVNRTGRGCLCATTHEDILDDLNPDVLVRCQGDGLISVKHFRVKKKLSVSPTHFGSVKVPEPIGRTSLGGIIAAITSAS